MRGALLDIISNTRPSMLPDILWNLLAMLGIELLASANAAHVKVDINIERRRGAPLHKFASVRSIIIPGADGQPLAEFDFDERDLPAAYPDRHVAQFMSMANMAELLRAARASGRREPLGFAGEVGMGLYEQTGYPRKFVSLRKLYAFLPAFLPSLLTPQRNTKPN